MQKSTIGALAFFMLRKVKVMPWRRGGLFKRICGAWQQ